MNRTVTYLVVAAGLALSAVVLGARPAPPLPPGPPVVPPGVSTSGGSLGLEGRLSHPYVSPGTSEVFVTVDVRGAQVPGAARSPVNLALVIDRSGSMSGYKVEQARRAARHLVGLLREDDRLAIVHYGSDVRALPSATATPANRARMLAYIDRIAVDGGTNIAAGLGAGEAQLAAARAGYKVNRLILISDGQPTEGMTSAEGLSSLARRIRAEGTTVSAIGVGTDFNEDLMQGLAEVGAGAYGFLEDAGQLATLFQKDLEQAGRSVARGVELTFELPEGVELREVLGYRSHQAGRSVRVPLSDFSAGQLERVVARLGVTAAAAGRSVPVTGLRLAYTDLLAERNVESVAQLGAVVTERREEVAAHQDKDAAVYAARAQSAQNLQKAAQALAAGRRDEARSYVEANTALLSQASAVAGSAPVAQDVAEQAQTLKEIDAAASPEDVAGAVKRQKTKAAKGFGRLGSTY